tara:strand:+ start:475 stop:669 length:195 start_codon:yes stop_codon:yes gene_type:complete
MSEDPNEQLGKLINGGYFFGDKFEERIKKNLCPRCSCYTQLTKDTNYRKCPCCQGLIQNETKIH